jgi:hypothetical protein
MFGKRIRRQRESFRAQLLRARFRRLRVEPMEGRLMLSATSFEINYSNLQFGPFPADNIRQVFAPAQLSAPSASIDGGFINLDVSGISSNFTDADGSPVLPGDLSYASPSDVKVFTTTGSSTTNRTETALFNNGLQLVRYVNVGASLVLEPATSASVAKSIEGLNSSEGGAISIPALVASLQHEEHLAKIDESSLPTTIEASGEPRRSVHSATSAKVLFSGEWARAAMFETVGGERSTNQLPNANSGYTDSADDVSNSAKHTPISVTSKSSETKTAGQQDNALQERNRNLPVDRDHEPTSAPPVRPAVYRIEAADWSWIGDVQPVASFAAPTKSYRQGFSNFTGNADGSNTMVLASDAMFDEIGQPTTMIESATDGESNLATRSAVPLLMILALERIATFNSRQSARTSPTAPPRPRRQQS